jgi:ABC-2 type transport system permease protein
VFHVKRLRQIVAIASYTARELVRNPAFIVLVAAGAALAAASPLFAVFHLGEQVKLVADLGLGTALLVGLLVGVLGASWEVSEEIESLTVYAVLSKPISRASYVVGKYAGVVVAAALGAFAPVAALMFTLRALSADGRLLAYCGLAALAMAVAGGMALRRSGLSAVRSALAAAAIAAAALVIVLDTRGVLAWFGRSVQGWSWELLTAYVGIMCQIVVLCAVAIALSVRLSIAATLPLTLGFFVLGQVVGDAGSRGGIGGLARYVVPDLGAFQFSDAVAEQLSTGTSALGPAVGPGMMAFAVAVAAAYASAALLMASALFARRDVQ